MQGWRDAGSGASAEAFCAKKLNTTRVSIGNVTIATQASANETGRFTHTSRNNKVLGQLVAQILNCPS